jgi:hypothetical protein
MHLKLERGVLAIFSTVSTKFGTYSALSGHWIFCGLFVRGEAMAA